MTCGRTFEKIWKGKFPLLWNVLVECHQFLTVPFIANVHDSMTEEQLKADEKDSGIHLGSTYASKMGFDGFVGYKAPLVKIPFVSSSVATSPKKKKKSKNKRKKKVCHACIRL
jgi:hypothetical protein